jgi:hypothetical protein
VPNVSTTGIPRTLSAVASAERPLQRLTGWRACPASLT